MRNRFALVAGFLAAAAPVAVTAQAQGAGEDPAQVAARSLMEIAAESALLEKCGWVPAHAIRAARFQADVTYTDLVAGSPPDAAAQLDSALEQARERGRNADCAVYQPQAQALVSRMGGQLDITLVQASILASLPAGSMLQVTDAEKREVLLSKGRTQGIVGADKWDEFARQFIPYTEEMARSLCQVRKSSMPAGDQQWCAGSETANPGLAPIREVFATGMEGFIKEFAAWHIAQRRTSPARTYFAEGSADRSCLIGDAVWDFGNGWRRMADGDRAELIYVKNVSFEADSWLPDYGLYIRMPGASETRVDPDASRIVMTLVATPEEIGDDFIVGALAGDMDMPADILAEERWQNASVQELADGRKITSDVAFEQLLSLGLDKAVAGSITGSQLTLVRCAE